MKARPPTLVFLAVILCAVAMAMPLQIMGLYGHSIWEWKAIAGKLTYLNWLVMVGSVLTAYLLVQGSELSRPALALLTLLVAVNNLAVGWMATDYSPWTAIVSTLMFASLNWPLQRRGELADLMDHPEKRWWRHAPRRRVRFPIVMVTDQRTPVRAQTYDLSESGAFVEIRDSSLRVNDLVTIRLTFGALAQVRCLGRVVRQAEAAGSQPPGLGIEFVNLEPRQRQELRRHLAL